MADVTKFVRDDHNRIRRSVIDYRRTPNLDNALHVCEVLWIHMTIEVELIHAAMWDDLAPADAAAVSAADGKVHQLMEAIDRMEANDPSLSSRVEELSRAVEGHIAAYQKFVLPNLDRRPDSLDLGARAFRRWQELFEQQTPRGWTPMRRLANTGWGGGGKIANSGW